MIAILLLVVALDFNFSSSRLKVCLWGAVKSVNLL